MNTSPDHPKDTTRVIWLTPLGQTVALFRRLGGRPIPLDRTGWQSPFSTRTYYSDCPRCAEFAQIYISHNGNWQASCSCWGRPWEVHDRLDALEALRGQAA